MSPHACVRLGSILGTVMRLAPVAVASLACLPNPAPVQPGGMAGMAGTGSPPPPPPLSGVAGTGSTATGGVSGSSGVGGRAPATCTTTATAPTMVRARGIIFPPALGPAPVAAPVAPPSVSGGTLRVLSDGVTAVAADPDRDRVYVVDLSSRTLRGTVMLGAGDEPGRVIQDTAGRVHVALRRGGAVVSIDPVNATAIGRRHVCAAPRGIAHDPGNDLLHVACADGELVSLPAAGGAAVRTVNLDRDLRDVVIAGSRLMVSRFRSAELLAVESTGVVSARMVPPAFRSQMVRAQQVYTAGAAWQTAAQPDGSVVMLHQRGVVDVIHPAPGGYGGANPCDAIVHPAITVVSPDGSTKSGPALAGLVMAVDMALSPDGTKVAVISAGNATNQQQGATSTPQLSRVFVTDFSSAVNETVGCRPDGKTGPCLPPSTTIVTPEGSSLTGCAADPQVVGQPIAVAFAGDGSVVIQSREPAMLAMADGNNIPLSTESREDTGHLVFHANAGGFVACASCHVEGDDDGRVWSFECSGTGARRTQTLQAGVRGTEPLHWAGDEATIDQLMADVFVGRMSGPKLVTDQVNALLTWIDAQPRRPRTLPTNAAAIERGRLLFHDARTACATCHSGARMSNDQTVDVGTGRAFQVPTLIGIATRGPFMHDGCASTLRDRFLPQCGGGDMHGVTSHLSETQISDLVAYLESL